MVVRVAIITMKINKYDLLWACVCSFTQTICKAHVPHYVTFFGRQAVQYLSTFYHKYMDYGKRILNMKYIFMIFRTYIEIFLILRGIQLDTIKTGLLIKFPVFLSGPNRNWIFSICFGNVWGHNVSKSLWIIAVTLFEDGLIWVTIVTLTSFANSCKIWCF
jgi:hypothetical protein